MNNIKNNVKSRRRKIIIDGIFQTKYALKLFLSILSVSIITSLLLYWWHASYLKQILVGLDIYDEEMRAIMFKETFSSFLPVLLLMTTLSLLIAVYALFVFHKMAGPVFRLNKFMKKVEDGSYDLKLIFREGDEFKEIAENFNRMLSAILNKEKEEIRAIKDFEARIDSLIKEAEDKVPSQKYQSLKGDMERLRKKKEIYLEEKL